MVMTVPRGRTNWELLSEFFRWDQREHLTILILVPQFRMKIFGLKGFVRSLGISNFNAAQTQKLLDICKMKPVTNQVECHPYLNNEKLRQFSLGKGWRLATEGRVKTFFPRPWFTNHFLRNCADSLCAPWKPWQTMGIITAQIALRPKCPRHGKEVFQNSSSSLDPLRNSTRYHCHPEIYQSWKNPGEFWRLWFHFGFSRNGMSDES